MQRNFFSLNLPVCIKKDSGTGVFCEFSEMFQNIYSVQYMIFYKIYCKFIKYNSIVSGCQTVMTCLQSFISFVRKISRKTNISHVSMHTLCVCISEEKNVSFSENFVYVLNRWSLIPFGFFLTSFPETWKRWKVFQENLLIR